MSIVVKNNIHWVGQRDWEVRDFHGIGRPAFRKSRLAKYVLGHHHGSRRSQSRSIAGYAA